MAIRKQKSIITNKQALSIIEAHKTGGHFRKALLKTVQYADLLNIQKLYKIYPYLVIAVLRDRKIKFDVKKGKLILL